MSDDNISHHTEVGTLSRGAQKNSLAVPGAVIYALPTWSPSEKPWGGETQYSTDISRDEGTYLDCASGSHVGNANQGSAPRWLPGSPWGWDPEPVFPLAYSGGANDSNSHLMSTVRG